MFWELPIDKLAYTLSLVDGAVKDQEEHQSD